MHGLNAPCARLTVYSRLSHCLIRLFGARPLTPPLLHRTIFPTPFSLQEQIYIYAFAIPVCRCPRKFGPPKIWPPFYDGFYKHFCARAMDVMRILYRASMLYM